MTIYFVTGNASKLAEARAILGNQIESITLDLPEYQGTAEDICLQKATLAAQLTGKEIFIEDVSMCFEALGGFPGPYIKWFLKANSLPAIASMLETLGNTRAKAVCLIGYCKPGSDPILFTGEVAGHIVQPRGSSAFGWDPIFIPDGYTTTFAELGSHKNEISHRKKALDAFKEYLRMSAC